MYTLGFTNEVTVIYLFISFYVILKNRSFLRQRPTLTWVVGGGGIWQWSGDTNDRPQVVGRLSHLRQKNK